LFLIKYFIKFILVHKLICNIYNEIFTNLVFNRDIRLCFKQEKYNINAYFNWNNVIIYNTFNIDKFTKLWWYIRSNFFIYIIAIAGAESAIGLGILVAFYRLRGSIAIEYK